MIFVNGQKTEINGQKIIKLFDKKAIKLGKIQHAVFDFKKEILALNYQKHPNKIYFYKIDNNFFKSKKFYLEVNINLEIYDNGPSSYLP